MRWTYDRSDLYRAVRSGDVPLVEEILDGQPELIHERDVGDRSLLFWAALEGFNRRTTRYASLIEILLDAGAVVGWAEAIVLGIDERLEHLIREDRPGVTSPDSQGLWPLHHAAACGAVSPCRRLLEAGASPVVRDRFGDAPMDHATARSPWRMMPVMEVVAILREWGVEIEAHHAVNLDDPEALRVALSRCPSSLSWRDAAGDSLLHLAAVGGHARCVGPLIEAGLDVDTAGRQGRTPLVSAVLQGAERDVSEIVLELLGVGADPLVRDRRGCSARTYAEQLGRRKLVAYLERDG